MQFCVGFVGCVFTVTAYVPVTNVANANFILPVPVIVRSSPPLSSNTNPAPVNPFTVPPIENPDEHVTATFVTFAAAAPAPLVTTHVCTGFDGCVSTVTLYAPGTSVANVNVVAPAVIGRLSPPLSCNTNPVLVRPVIVPPIENLEVQATWTFVTLAEADPEPLLTVHVCVGFVGCVCTVTLYVPFTNVLNVNCTVPAPLMVNVSVALSANTNPDPLSPVIVPPIVYSETQVTWTFVTLADEVPDPFVTVQVCPGFVGWVPTVTA